MVYQMGDVAINLYRVHTNRKNQDVFYEQEGREGESKILMFARVFVYLYIHLSTP